VIVGGIFYLIGGVLVAALVGSLSSLSGSDLGIYSGILGGGGGSSLDTGSLNGAADDLLVFSVFVAVNPKKIDKLSRCGTSASQYGAERAYGRVARSEFV